MAIGGLALPAVTTTTPALAVTNGTPGTDVASFQHPTTTSTINWTDVAGGEAFVGIKASEGNYYTNPYYAGNAGQKEQADAADAIAVGLYVTPYIFANPADPKHNGTAVQQADYGANVIKASTSPAYKGSHMLPVTLDIEPNPYTGSNSCYGLSQSAMRTWISQFVTEIKKDLGTSKAPIIYTTADWWNTCTGNDTAFSGDPLWLASYGVTNPALPAGWNNFTIWQYNQGAVSGIAGSSTDLDQLGPGESQGFQISQAGKAIAALQLRTLTSLAGTASTYSSSSLPAGLKISSSGQITGTPTTAGIGTHTVTVSTSGVPSSMSFTWIVHGTITVISPGNRTTSAGTPVSLQIPVSDSDGSSYPPTLSMSGLPSGLTWNSTGLITGWPTKPGTYTVRVSASDNLYASGSATFTWTINAASDSGYTGPVKQVGGTGKCLDDPASATANGTKVDLWSCNGKSNQSWTVAQDGTIRVLGKCLAESGTTVELWACGSQFSDQEWRPGTNGGLVNEQSGDCLYFKGANAVNGSKPTMAPCSYTNLSGEEWSRPAANVFSGEPGKCLAASGSAVSVPTCANVASQHWVAAANGTLQLGTDCLTAPSGATTGSVLTYGSCSGTAAMWTLLDPQDGIATEFESAATSGLCATASGTQVILEACSTVPADTWRIQ
jgi:GH25 family lysozyme M1 (1,4-beta-N-acetylmuramidase)